MDPNPMEEENNKEEAEEEEEEEEQVSDHFTCAVCLDLPYKPVVLVCGHVTCFWCCHRSMDMRGQSHCPLCRHPYRYFPAICRMLDIFLKKMYPVSYARRKTQTLEDEEQTTLDCLVSDEEVDQPVTAEQSSDINSGGKSKDGASADKEEEDGSEEDSEAVVFECPEPDFTNFENNRIENSFRAGQIWACYDTEDAMPRFYAFIIKVLSPGFKLQIFWLKPDPVNEEEIKWVDEDLPVSCGMFTHGKYDKAEDLYAFSHLVSWQLARSQKGGLAILPRIGETWALFKNWNINWRTDEKRKKRKYEYEFVEILSDYDENSGVRVSYLEKVKGFVSIFRPNKEHKETVIGNGSDKYRFAHMVPSVKMSGEERKGVPKGSYELDPAALPQSIFEQLNL